jgi:hypothetical protein
MKRLLAVITPLVLAAGLGGCAVYAPPPGYAYGGYPAYPEPAYVAPAPVYVPSVSFGLGVWGGGGHHGGGWHH